MYKLWKTGLASVAALALLGAASSNAADIPCDTAQLIVPWKAGGGTHVIFSEFEKTIQELNVQPKIQVVTVPGQGGNKGAKEAAKAAPDGCTLFAIHQSAVTSFLNGRIDFHFDGFETVANLTSTPDIVGSNIDTPYNTFEEFKAYAEENPEAIKVGATFGSTSQFLWLLLEQKMGVKFSYVPYDGTAERMTALLSGAIDMGSLNVASGSKHFETDSLKGLAIAADDRDPQVPDMPTLKELGIDLSFALERGIVAPKGTPEDVIAHWSDIFKQATEDQALIDTLTAKGTGIDYQAPDEYRAWAGQLYADYEEVAIAIGMYKK